MGALTEILQPVGVHSEWRLLLPALGRCGAGAVVLVGAPHVPFGPALQAQGLRMPRLLWVVASDATDCLWATEQALRCAEVDVVLTWLPQRVRPESLRRLQMAAAQHAKLLFAMRTEAAHQEASPAVLRLRVKPCISPHDALEVWICKRRGPPLSQALFLGARPARLAQWLAAHADGAGGCDALDRSAMCG